MATAALSTTAKIRSQPQCPWLKKMWHTHTHTHTLEYYSSTRIKETQPHVTTWMDLEDIKWDKSDRERQTLYNKTQMQRTNRGHQAGKRNVGWMGRLGLTCIRYGCVCVCLVTQSGWLFATPWTIAHQTALFMGFYKQEYGSGLPFPSPGHYGYYV